MQTGHAIPSPQINDQRQGSNMQQHLKRKVRPCLLPLSTSVTHVTMSVTKVRQPRRRRKYMVFTSHHSFCRSMTSRHKGGQTRSATCSKPFAHVYPVTQRQPCWQPCWPIQAMQHMPDWATRPRDCRFPGCCALGCSDLFHRTPELPVC